MSYFNPKYFSDAKPVILGNENLRLPQVMAYTRAEKYYQNKNNNRSGLIVLPTGTGKTGVITILPFALCKKRTLVIAPSTVIRDGLLDEMTGTNPKNFWYDKNILTMGDYLPVVVEYTKDLHKEALQNSNIVVINIDKAMNHLDSSLLRVVDKDFFDLIIIDEAHHAPAESWQNCIKYFEDAKIVNLTGTPFRTDNQPIDAELIYQYQLSRAMANGYVKSLENIIYAPGELRLTIDDDPKEYTVDEIYEQNIKDSDWVSRSVALSHSCSESVVAESLKLLHEKKSRSTIPHKIIAVACSVDHAKQIKQIYESKGAKSAIVYYDAPDNKSVLADIKNHRVDVVINIAMLGEGYDHPYLSIAAIFRPFRNDLPYAQFIGRILRRIHNAQIASDNIAQVVSHHHLYLESLWGKYKKEIDEANIIADLNKISEELSDSLDSDIDDYEFNDNLVKFPKKSDSEIGMAKDIGKSNIRKDSYLDTELIKRHEEEKKKENEQIEILKSTLNISDMEAREIINRTQGKNTSLNRPDLLIKQNRKEIDVEIREIIVPQLLENNNIDPKSKSLAQDIDIFIRGAYAYIGKYSSQNTEMLAKFFNIYLKNALGKGRKEWTEADYEIAWEKLDEMKNLIDKKLKRIND